MMNHLPLIGGVVGFVVAAVAIAWPYLPTIASIQAQPAVRSRAHWVNDLFDLVASADAQTQPLVADAARALIAALVASRGK